jgi:hypothetical protein
MGEYLSDRFSDALRIRRLYNLKLGTDPPGLVCFPHVSFLLLWYLPPVACLNINLLLRSLVQ